MYYGCPVNPPRNCTKLLVFYFLANYELGVFGLPAGGLGARDISQLTGAYISTLRSQLPKWHSWQYLRSKLVADPFHGSLRIYRIASRGNEYLDRWWWAVPEELKVSWTRDILTRVNLYHDSGVITEPIS